jgi:hypothetical protein
MNACFTPGSMGMKRTRPYVGDESDEEKLEIITQTANFPLIESVCMHPVLATFHAAVANFRVKVFASQRDKIS